MRRSILVSAASVAFAALAAFNPVHAQSGKIGVASSVKNTVQGRIAGRTRDLASGSGVVRNETVSTGADSATQLLFLDRTSVTLGANARLTLNTFVYNPSRRTGEVVARAAKGAFRFVSGLGRTNTYKLETPRVTIGIRGSILEGFIDEVTGTEVFVVVQGRVVICLDEEDCVTVDQPGQYVMVTSAGGLVGPAAWRGPMLNLDAAVNFVRVLTQDVLETGDDPLPRTRDPNDAEDARRFDKRFGDGEGEEEPPSEPDPPVEP